MCVPGCADVTEDGSRGDAIAHMDISSVRIEMGVVVNARALADYRNGLAAEVVLANLVDEAPGSGEDGSSATREDVLTFVTASGATRRTPSVGDCTLRHVFQRHDEFSVRILGAEVSDSRVKEQGV